MREADHRISKVEVAADGSALNTIDLRERDGTRIELLSQATSFRSNRQEWFQRALVTPDASLGPPALLPGRKDLGITMAMALKRPGGHTVLGSTLPLRSLEVLLDKAPGSEGAAYLLLDEHHNVLGYSRLQTHPQLDDDSYKSTLTPLTALSRGAFAPVAARLATEGSGLVEIAGETWVWSNRFLPTRYGPRYQTVAVMPLRGLTEELDRSRAQIAWIALGVLLVTLPITWYLTRRVVREFRTLERNSLRVQHLDFDTPPDPVTTRLKEIHALAHAQLTAHTSIAQRTRALQATRDELALLIQVGIDLSREQDRQKLLDKVLATACRITDASGGLLYLRTADDMLTPMATLNTPASVQVDLPMRDAQTDEPIDDNLAARSAWSGATLTVDDVLQEQGPECALWKEFYLAGATPYRSAITAPLRVSSGQVLGVLCVMRQPDAGGDAVRPFDRGQIPFIEALAAQAAVALENQQLLEVQRDLTDATIRIMANAIDTKSGYTGGHCTRVPELAFMLAEEATQASTGTLAAFGFHTEEQWREFRVGAWLHDCGKVTTPEHVMDKATKLEMVHNRIHELRTRFEVLLRDARITALQAIAAGADARAAWQACAEQEQQLHADFAFVAQCNLGAEGMAPADQARLEAIAGHTWLRHFDDRLGLAWGELAQLASEPQPALPATERLLADKPRHRVPRPDAEIAGLPDGIRMDVPELLYDHGELYNLRIARGTLTAEERFKINDHIIQTIRMLEDLPFPPNLRRVAEYAGTHHETMAGDGYPRRLNASQLSVPARIMAIADIFEALTAPDRPYKKAKTLSEAVALLHTFKLRRHIDAELFDLFLLSGTHLRYAHAFLAPEQIDTVEIAQYLG